MPTTESLLRTQFLDFLFGEREGFVCLAIGTPKDNEKDGFNQEFFKWPAQKALATKFVEGSRTKNVWFCVNLLDSPERTKPHCLPTNIIWADLDNCHPSKLDPQPQIVIESSPDRYQALWILDENVPAAVAEEYSKRIYSKYRVEGVDSGWALTKLLRIPFTVNYKYASKPTVHLLRADENHHINPSIFEELVIQELTEANVEDIELPNLVDLPSSESVIYAHRYDLGHTAFLNLYTEEPPEDWSSVLWRLIKICSEVGMTKEEAFVIAATSKCNKYERDDRPIRHLWLDVVKAYTTERAFAIISGELDEDLEFPTIINDDERALIQTSWIDEYISWACKVTDAPIAYNEISGTLLLSMMLADKLHLNVEHGQIFPNLWGLILGESSLTRKTTAMELAMQFVLESDPESIVSALDSSAEGLLKTISNRPDKVSIYYRDEVSGFFNAIANKTYLAGMPETLAKLYDVPSYLPRQLSKETVTVVKPYFIFFGGGIQDRMYEAVNDDFFTSGFLPRFLVVNGESDIDSLRWIGPPSHKNTTNPRDTIQSNLEAFLQNYKVQIVPTKILGQEGELSKEVEVILTDDAWEKMRSIEQTLVRSANQASLAMIALPTFTRMSTSLLKMAMLFAASRQEPRDFQIEVELRDVLQAAKFVTQWAPHTIHMMSNVGNSQSERLIQKILKAVRSHPGIPRSEIMRRHHLQSIPAKSVFSTLEERGLIITKQSGRGYRVWPV
jgi:predicted transcriptional regulator